MRILIAEDDLASRMYLEKVLSAYGNCDIAVDGIEAIDSFLTAINKDCKPYDLICLDIMMPRVDGIKALKTIRKIEMQKNIKDGKQAKIIMITALSEKQTVDESFETGCDAYATKPFDRKKLAEVIEKLGIAKT